MAFDPESFRASSRGNWERAAAGWTERRAPMQRDAQAVTQWLVDAIDPQAGQVVLEVAAGLGDTGLMVAELVGPEGEVILTDGAEAMVAAAAQNALDRGLSNVQARQMEAEWLDQGTATVDALLCRWGYMLVADPEAALREARRVLKPGGRLALAAWEPIEDNPWIGVVLRVLAEQEIAPLPQPGVPGMFSLAAPGEIEELLAAAGFTDIVHASVDFEFHAASADAWWDHLSKVSVSLGEALEKLAPAEHYALRDAIDAGYAPFTTPDGSLRLPARSLVASAEA